MLLLDGNSESRAFPSDDMQLDKEKKKIVVNKNVTNTNTRVFFIWVFL